MPVTITRNPNLSKSSQLSNLKNEVQINFKNIYNKSWWTGLSPEECPGFDKEKKCLVSLPFLNLSTCTRQDVLDSFNNVWTITELLFQSLKTEETFIRSPYHGLRHPMIFYYGHTAVVYFNKMRLAGIFKEPINLYLEKILETGVDEMSWDDMSKNEMRWPSVEEVHSYRKTIYEKIVDFIKNCSELDESPEKRNFLHTSQLWALWMGMEHEKIHIETSSVLIRELPLNLVERPEFFPPLHPDLSSDLVFTNNWIKGSAKEVVIGKPANEPSYGWDNEYGNRKLQIKEFMFSKYQITNREYFDFVSSGAYVVDKYWSPEGLMWRKFRNTKRPTFWVGVGPEGSHDYELRTIFEYIKMPWNAPVEVNFHEALAYANWKKEQDQSAYNYRLFTEAEFISLRKKGEDPVFKKTSLNFNLNYSSVKNVDESLYGNTWHWMMDQFNPLDGFKVHYLYDDFSTPCFDGKHQMILGGSFISCGNEASHWARFHFRPHFYQHAGFRLAYTLDGSDDNSSIKLNGSIQYVHPRRNNVLDQMKNSDWWKNVNQPLEFSEEESNEFYNSTVKELVLFNRNFDKLLPGGTVHDPSINNVKRGFQVPHIKTIDFPQTPENYQHLIKTIFDEYVPMSMLPGHKGFLAYLAGSGNLISNTAQLISQTINAYTSHYMMAPGLVSLEEEAISWFIHLFGFNKLSASGFFTSGSSLALLSGMMMARQKKINGNDFSRVCAYVSEEAHHSVAKNWALLGFKLENLKKIKATDFKMDPIALENQIKFDLENHDIPFLVVLTLGSTKTGAVDDIRDILSICKKYNLWGHGDAAYGGAFYLTSHGQEVMKGIDECDSINLDLHKAFSLPYGTGLLLVKEKQNMLFNYLSDESYMPLKNEEHVDFADISPELSRDYRGLRVWLPIKTLGIGPFILNLEEKLELIKYARNRILENKKLQLVTEPTLTVLTFKHAQGEEKTKALLNKINNDQTIFLSTAKINGETVIRLSLISFRLHFDHLKRGLDVIKSLSENV